MASKRKARQSDGKVEGEPARALQHGAEPARTEHAGSDIETVEANLQSTYEYPSGSGRLYGPGERILVPRGLADQLNVALPASEAGFHPASRQIESREDAAHPAGGLHVPKQGAGLTEGRQK